MSVITRMSIQGVRSFGTDPGDEQLVKFDSPLTLILGENGCGKTTIIECIKYSLTGELPPGSDKGINFGHNPKISKSAVTQGQVKLKLMDPITKRVLVITRSFQLTQEQKKMSFKSKDSAIHWEDMKGQKGSISGRCVDINHEMIATMGVSKPILSDVLFCHQEDSYWPLDEGKKLKEKFDAIFDATKYNKCMDILLKLRKSKEAATKDSERDVSHYKYVKDEATSKRTIMKQIEIKYQSCTENIIRQKENLVPIEDRLRQISEVENNIIALKTEQKSLEINLQNCIRQQEELLNNIKEVFQGDTETLHQKIDYFQKNLCTKKRNLESANVSLKKLEEKENECSKKITQAEVRKGELISMRSQEQELLANRNTELNTIAIEIDLQVEEIDDLKQDVSDTINSVKQKITQIHHEIDHLTVTFDRDDNKQQEKLNKLRDNEMSLRNEIKSKTSQMNNIDNEADNIKKQIDEIDMSASKLKQLSTEIETINREQQSLQELCDVDKLKKQVTEKINTRKSLETNLDKIDKELYELQKQSGLRAELELQKQQLADKTNEIKKIKNKYTNQLSSLFGTNVPSSNFKLSVQKKYDDFYNEVNDLNNIIKKKEHESIALKANREHQREQIKSLTNELNKYEEQIDEECQGQDFESELSKLNDSIQKNLKHRGTLSSSSFIYEKYIETFERDDPCCPLCHRNFENQEDVTELSNELKIKLRRLPAELDKTEIVLKRDQIRYDKLLSLKPINERIGSIKQELPILKEKCKKTEVSLQNILSEVENYRMSICEPQSNMQLANSLIPDMSILDQGTIVIQKLQNEVNNLQYKLPKQESEWTLHDAQAEQSVIKAELQQIRNDIENLQNKISKQSDKINELREKKNKLVEEQLRLQSGFQARSQLAESYEKLREQLAVLSVDIEKCKYNLPPLQRQYDEALSEKNSNFEKNRFILKEKNNFVTNLEKKFDNILKDTTKLQQFSRQNLSMQVEDILKNVQDLYEKRDELLNSKKKIQQEINELKDFLSNQEVKERDLSDNLTLRQKKIEEDNLKQKMNALKIKMGDMNTKNILLEKSDLIQKHTNTIKSISELKGQSDTLEDQLKAVKKELQTKYKDADKQYLERLYKLEGQKQMVKNLANYSMAMEWAIIKYHEEKMTKINVLIKKMWREIYKGNDIDYIMIKTDEATGVTSKKRTYNYRVVQIKNDVEIDMRGRCSAGQKVLACLIIRMALAEIFSVNCGVIALDEPTTNLDRTNIDSLAMALGELVESRSAQRNFMLIVISHDEEFIEALSRVQELTKFHRVTRNRFGKSVISRIQIHSS